MTNQVNNQDIFNMMAEHEMQLFYASRRDMDNEALKEAHKAAKMALEAFAKATGCHN